MGDCNSIYQVSEADDLISLLVAQSEYITESLILLSGLPNKKGAPFYWSSFYDEK